MFCNLNNVCFVIANVLFAKDIFFTIFCDSKDTFQTSFKRHISTYSKYTFQKDTFQNTHFKTHISCDQFLFEKYKSWNVSFDIIIWVFKIQICFSIKDVFVFQKSHLYFEFPSGIPDRDDEICLLSKILCVLKRHICFSTKYIFAFQKSYLFFEF